MTTRNIPNQKQYYQQKRAEEGKQDRLAQQILATSDPAKQKFLGNKTKVEINKWKPRAMSEMLKAIQCKFEQNEDLKEKLLATNDLLIGEASTNMFWGIGSTLQNPQSQDPGT